MATTSPLSGASTSRGNALGGADRTSGLYAGSEAALRLAVHAVRPSGGICAIGLTGKPTAPLEWDGMMRRRIQVAFAWSADSESFEGALSLMANGSVSFPQDRISSFSLDKWRDAFEALETRKAVKAQFVSAGQGVEEFLL